MPTQNEMEIPVEKDAEAQKAIEEIGIIKEIMNKTSVSLINLSHTFIQFGLLMLGVAVLFRIYSYFPSVAIYLSGSPITSLTIRKDLILPLGIEMAIRGVLFLILLIAAIFLCKKVMKRNILQGMSKQLMILWIYIIVLYFVFNVLIIALNAPLYYLNSIFNIDNIDGSIFRSMTGHAVNNKALIHIPDSTSMLPIQLFLCAIGLTCISIFTRFKGPIILAAAYVLLGLYFLLTGLPLEESWVLFMAEAAWKMLLPVTMIIVGIYLQLKKRRAN